MDSSLRLPKGEDQEIISPNNVTAGHCVEASKQPGIILSSTDFS